jgi:hypothetical protein
MFAQLKERSLLYSIFPHGQVPIRGTTPQEVLCETTQGNLEAQVYMVNLDLLTAEQFLAVATLIGKATGDTPAVVMQTVRERGLPLRVEHVASVSENLKFFV